MLGTLSVLFAILLPSGSGPIPQRIGAKLTYEALLPLAGSTGSSNVTDGDITLPVSWSLTDVRVQKTLLVVTVSDTVRGDSGLLWGLTLQSGIRVEPVRVSLLQRRDGSWTWRTASCLFPVDVEPGSPPPSRTVDFFGALAIGCSYKYNPYFKWRAASSSSSSLDHFASHAVDFGRSETMVWGSSGSSERRSLMGFEFGMPLTPRSKVYRAGVGWVRVQDLDAPASLTLLEVDGKPVPADWDPPSLPPSLTPQVRPQPGNLWVWEKVSTTWSASGSLTSNIQSSRSVSDTLVARILEVRDSAGWTVALCHQRDGVDSTPGASFTLRWNDSGTIAGDVDSASPVLLQSLVRPRVCLGESKCFVGRQAYWSNGVSGNGAQITRQSQGFDWTLGVGVTFSGSTRETQDGYQYRRNTDGWALLYGPDSLPPATASVRTSPRQTPHSLINLVLEHPAARFTVAKLDGSRQEWTGSELSRILPGLRGPVLWSVHLDGALRTGKHLRP